MSGTMEVLKMVRNECKTQLEKDVHGFISNSDVVKAYQTVLSM